MYPIVKKEKLADKIYLMDVKAPRVAQYCEPGQFVIVKIDEQGERIPLTICDYNREAGTITIVFQTVGASTQRMVSLEQGDAFADFVGPLGCPSDLIDEDIEELKKKGIQPDFCIVGEPTCSKELGDTIKNGRRGSCNCRVTIYGEQGHVAYPLKVENPIHTASKIISKLAQTQWDQGLSLIHI